MPVRSRPTARFLTPAGWAGVMALAIVAALGAVTLWALLPRA